MKKVRAYLTYPHVVSSVALFVALGGTAWAAAQIGSADIKDNAVHSKHIKDGQVKSADLAAGAIAGRIRAVGSTTFSEHGGPFPLQPGLEYSWYCSPGAYSKMTVVFNTNGTTGTANAMTVATGIEGQPYEPDPAVFNLADGSTVGGFPFDQGHVVVLLPNSSGESIAETQLLLDVGSRTYSINLHQYMRASDGYCEATGTATLAN